MPQIGARHTEHIIDNCLDAGLRYNFLLTARDNTGRKENLGSLLEFNIGKLPALGMYHNIQSMRSYPTYDRGLIILYD